MASTSLKLPLRCFHTPVIILGCNIVAYDKLIESTRGGNFRWMHNNVWAMSSSTTCSDLNTAPMNAVWIDDIKLHFIIIRSYYALNTKTWTMLHNRKVIQGDSKNTWLNFEDLSWGMSISSKIGPAKEVILYVEFSKSIIFDRTDFVVILTKKNLLLSENECMHENEMYTW